MKNYFLPFLLISFLAVKAQAVPLSQNKPIYFDIKLHTILVFYSEIALPHNATEEEIYDHHPELTFGDRSDTSLTIRAIRYELCGLAPQYLPASVFAGLYAIRDVSVNTDSKGLNTIINIVGGDASTSYRAEIELAHYGAVRKTIYNNVSKYGENAEYRYPLDMIITANAKLRKRQINSKQASCQSVQERQINRDKSSK